MNVSVQEENDRNKLAMRDKDRNLSASRPSVSSGPW